MVKLGFPRPTMFLEAVEWLGHELMLDTLGDVVARNLPHTFARYVHFLHLLANANLESYDYRDFLTAILPLHIFYFHEEIRIYYSGSWIAEPLFDDVVTSLMSVYFVLFFFNSLHSIGLVFDSPGLGGKLMCAVDLWVESACVFSVQFAFVLLVRAWQDRFFGWPTARFLFRNIREDFDDLGGALQQ